MSNSSATRREITPLEVPWLSHEQFSASKRACSSADGLVAARKGSVAQVVQELKRGQTHVDTQLAQLDSQLVAITDYLDGKTSKMFPPHLVVRVDDTVSPPIGSTAMGDERIHRTDGLIRDASAPTGKGGLLASSERSNPVTPLVEDDLAADTPCTTVGLWKYLAAYSFFKTITPEDMELALQLEDPSAFSEGLSLSEEDERREDESILTLDFERREDKFSLGGSLPEQMDEFYKERLVASLCSEDKPLPVKSPGAVSSSPSPPVQSQPEAEDEHTSDSFTEKMETEPLDLRRPPLTDQRSWSPGGLTTALRSIGLVEAHDERSARRSLTNPEDDEVCQEIRGLQRELRGHIQRTNETKRRLRQQMDKMKPWLSQKKELDEATVKRFLAMWHKKKELERKKKLREKKLQRRQALRLGGGGGSGKALADAKDLRR